MTLEKLKRLKKAARIQNKKHRNETFKINNLKLIHIRNLTISLSNNWKLKAWKIE